MSHQVRAVLAMLLTIAACDRGGPLAPVPELQGTAPVNPPIIWLHYDYMVAADHSHAPAAQTIETLKAVFRAHGITVVVDPRHAEIPERDCLLQGRGPVVRPEYGPQCALYGGSTFAFFDDLKATYFQPQGSQPWHYAIFAHHGCVNLGCGYFGGFADYFGYDFMIVSGALWMPDMPAEVREQALPRWEAGTTLHELGHNLGLQHGGNEEENSKPNYLSVMNYAYLYGIPVAAAVGSGDSVGVRFDYSDRAAPPLDEAHLDERLGLGIASRDLAAFACSPPGASDFLYPLGPAAGPIDWNCDGAIDSDVAQDLNVDASFGILRGYDDWGHINALLRTPAYLTGALRPERVVP